MREIFADTFFWLAMFNPRDAWHKRALAAREHCAGARLVTSDEVLTEFLTGLCNHGSEFRKAAAAAVRAILQHRGIEVIPQSHRSFQAGLERYERRLDKQYSLTDCISMQQMEKREIDEVLTHDHHFEQEGFTILLRDE